MSKCWTVRDESGNLLAILDSLKDATLLLEDYPQPETYLIITEDCASAVGELRRYIYERDECKCVACGQGLTLSQMYMHERKNRGQGGVRSRENCETLCFYCNLRAAH
ncbi:MAG TPA: HNH endonuclease signature motif containing protein [Candidatus Dormibacteraeota bacterium]|nr:HNH endonuclease signature motif containing protein [Candidatus Dormibacteraeota bacterium]